MWAQFRMMFSWETITPRGIAVEPDVYWGSGREEPVMAGSHQLLASSSGIWSVAIQRIARSSAACANSPSTLERIEAVVSTSVGCASLAIVSRRAKVRWGWAILRWGTGTAVTPAYRHPKKAEMNSRPAG